MEKKIKVEAFASDPTKIIIDGKTFRIDREKIKIIDHHLHADRLIFKEIDDKEFNADIDYIIENIQELVNKKKLLKEILKTTAVSEIKKIKKLLVEKKPVKRTEGCYGLTIGDDSSGAVIQLA